MLRTGWFKFHRQIFDNPICTKDAEHFFVWCYLLTEAYHEYGERALFQNKEITEPMECVAEIQKIVPLANVFVAEKGAEIELRNKNECPF